MGHGALRYISRLSPGEILHQTVSVVVDLMGAAMRSLRDPAWAKPRATRGAHR
jgi:hypothetical protein